MVICTRAEAEKKLKEVFNIDHFYDDQWSVISKLFHEKRIVLVKKTGYGKSLCYQFPSLYFDGITLVFSPLIALMREQVAYLNSIGIPAAYINSSNTYSVNYKNIYDAINNKIKILFITPEREKNKMWRDSVTKMNISMIVIDEAHVVSVWGHDFRQSYSRIIDLVKILPRKMPILATTATATDIVKEDIAKQIGFEAEIIHGDLNRDNLNLKVIKVKSEDEKYIWLKNNLNKLEGTGLIYVGTVADTKNYSAFINHLGISCEYYNGKRNSEKRKEIEEGLKDNRWKCIVATNSLGMGIDKRDIRFVIHTQTPQSIIHYYQEIGRAGRDGKKADVILLFNESRSAKGDFTDLALPLAFIESARPNIKKYYKAIELLKENKLIYRDFIIKLNVNASSCNTIIDDLINQNIISKVSYGDYIYFEYKYGAKPLNTDLFEEIRNRRYRELTEMMGYIYTNRPRMEYLCKYLDDPYNHTFSNCDNTNLNKEVVCVTNSDIEFYKEYKKHAYVELDTYNDSIRLTNGVAVSYYGKSEIGKIVHDCKYESKIDFPDTIVDSLANVYFNYFKNKKFDMLLFVPPTVSGSKVKNLAIKLSKKIKIPVKNIIIKTKETKEQKYFQNVISKSNNVKNSFDLSDINIVKGKHVLLLDDVFDSGETIKEISKMLSFYRVSSISPIVIAKTAGGDSV